MKICFLAPANSIHSHRWIQYFAGRGHDVHWVTLHPSCFDMQQEINLYQIKRCSLLPLNCFDMISQIKKLLRKINPDILHIHSLGAYGLGAFGGFRPFVATAWGSDILNAMNVFLKKKYVQYILREAACIVCDGYHMHEAIVNLGADPKKINLNFFGTDTSKFCPAPKDKILRDRLKIFDYPTIISTRNLYPVYNLETLIKSVPLVLKEIPNAKFLIVGMGPEKNLLKELAESLDVSRSISFLGEVRNSELPNYLTSSDIYVSTALSDGGISASIKEAMACELPVIITDSCDNRKWIIDGENGFIFPAKESVKLAEKIIFLIKNKQIRDKFGGLGRKIIQEKHDYYTEMKKMENVYYKIIESEKNI